MRRQLAHSTVTSRASTRLSRRRKAVARYTSSHQISTRMLRKIGRANYNHNKMIYLLVLLVRELRKRMADANVQTTESRISSPKPSNPANVHDRYHAVQIADLVPSVIDPIVEPAGNGDTSESWMDCARRTCVLL